ncbi:MAG: GntR family transcriptional regulator [Lentisphaeria bacterium]|nr:GntR family transcriptional regulator [Lentisphaeria bacterium]
MKTEWNYREIKLDRKRPEQLYYQLADGLGRLIRSHAQPGTLLPSALELSARLGINRATVRKAYGELVMRQLIERKSPYRYQVSVRKNRAGLDPFPSIGIILPCRFSALLANKENIGAAPCIQGIIDSAMEHKLSTVMLELPDFNASQAEIDAYCESLTKRLLGLVHIGGRDHFPDRPLEAVLRTRELPQVYIGGVPRMDNVGAVIEDNTTGIGELIAQLREMNHREIGIMLQFKDWEDLGPNRYLEYSMRFRGKIIRKLLEDSGIRCPDRYHIFGCGSYQATLAKLKEKYQSGNLPAVYWCHNDVVAHWTIRALNELGLRVPQDISVVGYDGLTENDDELTTIALPFYSMGHRSVTVLLDFYEHGITEKNRISYSKTAFIAGKTLTYAVNQTKK